jgi:hypothetical protein
VIYIVWLCVAVGDVNATRDHTCLQRESARFCPAENFEPLGQQRVAVIGDSAIALVRVALSIWSHLVISSA